MKDDNLKELNSIIAITAKSAEELVYVIEDILEATVVLRDALDEIADCTKELGSEKKE